MTTNAYKGEPLVDKADQPIILFAVILVVGLCMCLCWMRALTVHRRRQADEYEWQLEAQARHEEESGRLGA